MLFSSLILLFHIQNHMIFTKILIDIFTTM
nr:MAG TPA: hypothetical protein [Caudoviricetes sp.]